MESEKQFLNEQNNQARSAAYSSRLYIIIAAGGGITVGLSKEEYRKQKPDFPTLLSVRSLLSGLG